MDNTKYKAYLKSPEWQAISLERMKIDKFRCAGCNCSGTPKNPLEVHHISYKHLYVETDWIYEDLVTLCHSCHKLLHGIMNRQTNAAGRRGWGDNKTIPQIHVFNLSGTELSNFETEKDYS